MKRGFSMFPGIIFAFIALNICIVGVTVYLATSDPSRAVEPDYYQKAVAWDAFAKQRDHSVKLGWKAQVETMGDHAGCTLSVRVVDAEGQPVSDGKVHVLAFASARAADRLKLDLVESQPGVYNAPIRVATPGLWEFAITVRARNDVFTASVSQDVALVGTAGSSKVTP